TSINYSFYKNVQILYLPEVWHCDSDGSGAAITDFGGAGISDELALKKRRIQLRIGYNKINYYLC
ncbi:MAG: hypothetical protein VZR24_22055, partial [Butyrivibrio hungatei]|nr:hypothetical protein [Butyrivibrio hungatei]